MSEDSPNTISVESMPSSREYGLLAMTLLEPFYTVYKGFLKKGLMFGFFTTIL